MQSIQEKLRNADTLIDEFQAMRDLQKEYFYHGRSRTVLEKSKIQEKKVDKMIKQYKGIEPLQGKLW